MAFSNDADLVALVPDILTFGITSFSTEHAKAEADLELGLSAISGGTRKVSAVEMDASLPHRRTVEVLQLISSVVEVRSPSVN